MQSSVLNRLLELTKTSDNRVAIAAIHALGEGGPVSQDVVDRLMDISKKYDMEL
jgi:hypothetical protein